LRLLLLSLVVVVFFVLVVVIGERVLDATSCTDDNKRCR
jgi:hypothetical protein